MDGGVGVGNGGEEEVTTAEFVNGAVFGERAWRRPPVNGDETPEY